MRKLYILLLCLIAIPILASTPTPTVTPTSTPVTKGIFSAVASTVWLPSVAYAPYNTVDTLSVRIYAEGAGKKFIAIHSAPYSHPFTVPTIGTAGCTVTDLQYNASSISLVADCLDNGEVQIDTTAFTWTNSNNRYDIYYNVNPTPGLTPMTYRNPYPNGGTYSGPMYIFILAPSVTITPTVTQTVTPTSTITLTNTPLVTPTNTPIPVWYYTDKTIDSGEVIVDTSNGQKVVDLSSIAPWITNGFVVRLHSNGLPFGGKATPYKHSISFTASVEDFFLGTPIDCSINTVNVHYDVFRIPPP